MYSFEKVTNRSQNYKTVRQISTNSYFASITSQ